MSLRAQSIAGVRWLGAAHVLRSAISGVTLLVLARLLSPADFGVQAMAIVVVGLGLIVAEAGVRPALIQRLDPTPILLSSAFWTALAAGSAVMIIILVAAPAVARFYQEPEVTPVLRVLSLLFPISAARTVPLAILEKRLAFRRISLLEICSTVGGSAAAVVAAVVGLGVWSLVIQTITGSLALTSLLLLFGGWTPQASFHRRALRTIAFYALNHAGARLVEYLSRNVHDLVIGRSLGAPSLGQFTTAYQLMAFPVLAVSRPVARIVFPALARLQDDDERMARAFRDFAAAVATITLPLMFGLWVVADAFVAVALGPRWEPVKGLIRILAPIGALQSVTVLADTVLLAKGRAELLMRWNLIQSLCVLGGILIGLHWGLVGVAVAYALISVTLTYPWLRLAAGILHVPLTPIVHAVARPLLATIIMVAIMSGARLYVGAGSTPLRSLVLVAVLGAVSYLAMIAWLGERQFRVLARELLSR